MTILETSHRNDSEARRRILAVAAEEFASHGFGGARVDDIAARARVNKAMLYYYVGDKDALYTTVLFDVLADVLATVATSVAMVKSPEGRLRAAVDAIVRAAAGRPHLAPLLLREIASGGASLPEPLLAQVRLLSQILTDILAWGAAGGTFRAVDPVITQMALVGSVLVLIAGTSVARRLRAGSPSLDGGTALPLADCISELLLDGLRPMPKRAIRKIVTDRRS